MSTGKAQFNVYKYDAMIITKYVNRALVFRDKKYFHSESREPLRKTKYVR